MVDNDMIDVYDFICNGNDQDNDHNDSKIAVVIVKHSIDKTRNISCSVDEAKKRQKG